MAYGVDAGSRSGRQPVGYPRTTTHQSWTGDRPSFNAARERYDHRLAITGGPDGRCYHRGLNGKGGHSAMQVEHEYRVCPFEEIPDGGGVLGIAGPLEVGVFRRGS